MQKLNLKGDWKLRGEFIDIGPERFNEVLDRMAAEDKFTVYYDKTPNAFPSKKGSIVAKVPCDVTTALVDNGVIEEPFLKKNTEKCLWIRDFSWWFMKEFEVTEALLNEDSVRLYIEMLDFKADIIVNGRHAWHHTNTFCALDEDIKRFLRPGKNQILIRLTSGIEDNYPKDSVSFYCASPNAICDQRVHLRKPQFTYGWDWCQPVPTCGIGRGISINAFSGAKVLNSRVDTVSIESNKAELEFFFEIEKTIMTSSEEAVLDFSLSFDGEEVYNANEVLLLAGGINFFSKKVTIENPKLWWPNGYGEQNLYSFESSVLCRDIRNESKPKKIGIRTIELDQSRIEDGTKNFFFKVNGVRVFCKGGNWVPTDSVYLRTPDSSYKTLVEEGKAAGFTMFRMWGGGTYEPDCFYEYCSECGILIMHDFMYACGFYPDLDKSFMFEAAAEAEFQTKRLAHYPAMAIWTGNNEIHESFTDWFPEQIATDRFYGEKIFNYLLPEAVRKNCPRIMYMPSSPYFGSTANQTDEGDVHAWSYLGRREETKFKFNYELEAFDRMPARFSSEYGFFGAQMESTVRRYLDGTEMSFDNPVWKHHGEFQRKRRSIDGAIDNHLTDFSTLDEKSYLLYSGVMQGVLYSEMAEAMRSKPYGAGDLIWMYNDCWPETGWTIIDYYLTRKVSFYFLKRAFANKKLIVRRDGSKAVITVINESPENISLDLSYGYVSFDGTVQEIKAMKAEAGAHSWQQLEVEAFGDETNGVFLASAEEQGFEAADSLRGYYRSYSFPKANVQVKETAVQGNDLLVTLVSDAYVPVAAVALPDDRTHLSDNYVKLYPGKEKIIRIIGCTDTPEVKVVEMQPGEIKYDFKDEVEF